MTSDVKNHEEYEFEDERIVDKNTISAIDDELLTIEKKIERTSPSIIKSIFFFVLIFCTVKWPFFSVVLILYFIELCSNRIECKVDSYRLKDLNVQRKSIAKRLYGEWADYEILACLFMPTIHQDVIDNNFSIDKNSSSEIYIDPITYNKIDTARNYAGNILRVKKNHSKSVEFFLCDKFCTKSIIKYLKMSTKEFLATYKLFLEIHK